RYSIASRFVEQRVQDGTAGAVHLARPHVRGPVLIIFVDTVFEADLSLAATTQADGIIWAKEVDDYQRFGVVVTDRDGYMTRIVEKPTEPVSRLANIGLYFVRDVAALWRGIDHALTTVPHQGEYYLTDAFQHMIDHGSRILTAPVGGWYDCGQLETTLETNGILLEQGAARHRAVGPDVRLVEPVLIEDNCTLERCTIGPNVTVEHGSVIRDAAVAHAIIGPECTIERSTLTHAMLGDRVRVTDFTGSGSVGADSEIAGRA
ncbi:MAG: sugar phosphate nucleotidyltransferase, partial [Gemmatimonadales bacterium]